MEGDRPAKRPTGRGDGGVKWNDRLSETLLVARERTGDSNSAGDTWAVPSSGRKVRQSAPGRVTLGANMRTDVGSTCRGDNRIAPSGALDDRPTNFERVAEPLPAGSENKRHYDLPEPLRSGDVDLSAHGSGGARDRIRERLAGIVDRGSLALIANADAATASAHSLHGWSAYLSMVALRSGSPSCMRADHYVDALERFCTSYPLADGMMFPIEIGNLLEWLVDDLPSGDDPDIVGPACFFPPTDRYWTLVTQVADLFLNSLDVGPNRYAHVDLHLQIARGVLEPE